jgi:Tfp pilus assembly protein PilV
MRICSSGTGNTSGFTLVEAITSVCVAVIMITGVVNGFLQSAEQAEQSSYSLAAQAQAIRGLEQTRAAKWDNLGFPSVDQVVTENFPLRVEILDVPMRGDNIVYVTNFTTVATVSADPPIKLVRVDAVWSFLDRALHTNSAWTYRAPDQ